MSESADVERRILVLATSSRDARLTLEALRQAGLPCEAAGDLAGLTRAVGEGAGAVVVAEEVLLGSDLPPLLVLLSAQPAWSDLPFVVLGLAPGPGRQSPKLPALGNLTFLERPVMKSTLVSAARAALGARLRQYQVRALLDEQEQRVSERDQFLAMLGHELRNPLAAILTTTELMQRKDGQAFAHERAVIQRQTHHLCRLVDDLLDVSRITSGKISLERQPVDLVEVARRCTDVLRATAVAQELELAVALPAGPLMVDGDAVRLEQVLNNLVTNAIKYTPPEGQVRVALRREGGLAVARISDTGVGIEPQMLPRVFELFVQAPGTLDRSQGGMGIGLTLVKSLVELHGGTVSVDSAGLGRGSEFIVRLPVASALPRREALAPTTVAAPRRIVVVEDHGIIRAALEMMLSASGHTVEGADDGADGLERILATRPDVAIVDIGLPSLDGYDIARRVRAQLGPSILLVALSGYGQPEDRRRSMAAGFDAHLTKPVEMASLEELIARAGVPS